MPRELVDVSMSVRNDLSLYSPTLSLFPVDWVNVTGASVWTVAILDL